VLPPDTPRMGTLAIVLPVPQDPAAPKELPPGVPVGSTAVVVYFGPGTTPQVGYIAPAATPK